MWQIQTNHPAGIAGWTSWRRVSPSPVRGVAVVSSDNERLDAFTIGTDSAVHWKSGSAYGDDKDWVDESKQPVGAVCIGGHLAAVSRGRGLIDIFAIGPDHAIYSNSWT